MSALTGKRVLIVDDSRTVRGLLRRILTSQGAQVDEADSGESALERLKETTYDLILLDLVMPGMDGLEVLRRIRRQEAHDRCAIVILTGTGGVREAVEAIRQGADGYIQKQDLSVGGDYAEFFYALEQALQHRAGIVAQEELEQLRADFYSMVVHDLRSPASSALLATKMLADGDYGPLSPEQREILNLTASSLQKVINLVSDFLDYAEIEAGYLRLELEEVDLRRVVEESARMARLQAGARGQKLTLDLPEEPVVARVDPERLKQVVDNLLSNAMKYTPEGGQITLRLRVEGDEAVLQVSDTGQGIPPDQLPALFTKYHRVPGEATRGIVGTGLGLLIVKEIVEAHGGKVWAESEGVGKGSTFTVVLPLSGPSETG